MMLGWSSGGELNWSGKMAALFASRNCHRQFRNPPIAKGDELGSRMGGRALHQPLP